MDQTTHEVRTAQWREIIQNCQQRPTGQSAKQWLAEHQILEQSYYYWLRKFRNEAYEQMEHTNLPILENNTAALTFAELEVPNTGESPKIEQQLDCIMPTAMIKTATMSITISNDISEFLLTKIIQEVSHA